MSYQLYDVNGYVGDLATTSGLQELREFVEKTDNEVVFAFLRIGAGLMTKELIDGIKNLKPREANVRETVENLAKMIGSCRLIAIISDGLNEDMGRGMKEGNK